MVSTTRSSAWHLFGPGTSSREARVAAAKVAFAVEGRGDPQAAEGHEGTSADGEPSREAWSVERSVAL